MSLQRDDIKNIREYYKETNDVDGTLRKLPHNMVAERAIVSICIMLVDFLLKFLELSISFLQCTVLSFVGRFCKYL